jgi:hypothetical protein
MELQSGLIMLDGLKQLIMYDNGGVWGCWWWLAAGLEHAQLMKAAVFVGGWREEPETDTLSCWPVMMLLSQPLNTHWLRLRGL